MSSIVLFDGVCNFCNATVNFIIRHDGDHRFRFAPLQSSVGLNLRGRFGIGPEVDSIVLIEDDAAYTHSTAALRILRTLGDVWSLAYVFIMIPAVIRDYLYKLFGKYRYRIFGKMDTCMIPTPDVRERFLD
jgi:predicted DCC family thiol-disulfide oxidoreductase YuxK